MLPKFRNIAKSGHTVYALPLPPAVKPFYETVKLQDLFEMHRK